MAKKIEMLNDQQEVVRPLTSSDCVIMENGKTLEEVMGDGVATPTVTHEGASFQVGVGDSNIEVVDGDVAGMTLEGQTYQNILPKPTTLIMETDEKEFKINDKIDNNIVLDDNVAEIATIKGQTYVNVVQEESASEYVAIDEELNGQSITTTGKPEGIIKGVTLEGMTLVNTIQEPSEANSVVLDLDADVNAQATTINDTVQGGIHGAKLNGMTLVNMNAKNDILAYCQADAFTQTTNGDIVTVTVPTLSISYARGVVKHTTSFNFIKDKVYTVISDTSCLPVRLVYNATESSKSDIATPNSHKFTFIAPNDMTYISLYYQMNGTVGGSVTYKFPKSVIILEGDYTNVDIPYFRGMQSVEVPSVKTTGKNLLDKTENYNAETICGVQITTLGTNTFRLNGTVTKSGDISLCGTASGKHHVKIKPNTTYRAVLLNENDDVVEDLAVKVSNEDGSLVRWLGGVFATKNNETKAMWIRIAFADANIGKTYDNITVKAMLVETSKEVGEFEPYKSSTLTMKNILLISGGYTKGYINNNGDIFTTDKDFYTNDYTPIKPNIELTTNAANLYYYDENKNWIGRAKALGFTAPSNARYIKAQWDTTQGITINDLWVREKVTLRKVGDVQDELDLETGKLTQRTNQVILNGSETWTEGSTAYTNTLIFLTSSSLHKPHLEEKCDKFPRKSCWLLDEEGFYTDDSYICIRVNRSRLSTEDVDGFKAYLQSNPVNVCYRLKTPITRQIDLSIVDQDNNTVKTIQTQPTLTHVSTSSQGLIPNIVIPSQLKYPTIIKPSTTYTVQLKQTTANSEFPLTINLGGTVMAVPSTKFTITTPSELTSQDVIFTGKNNVIGEVVITEGDTTGIEYDYFEGMNDVKSPKLLARGKNLFDGQLEDGYLNSTDGSNLGWANYKRSVNFIKVNSKFKYRISKNATHTGGTFGVFQYDYNKKFITVHYISSTKESQTFTFDNRTEYIKVACTHNENEGLTIQFIQIEEGSVATSYEPYKGVTIEQSIDSIPLTSSMFEQGGYSLNSTSLIRGMSLQQIPLFNSDNRIKTKTLIKLKPNSTYTINADMSFSYACFNKDGNYLKAFDFCSNFTTDSETHYIVMNLRYADDSTITPSSLDSLNLTLQEVEDEIVLRSIGDVKDTLNLTTGEYVQRIGEVVLNGSENWQEYNTNSVNTYCAVIRNEKVTDYKGTDYLSDKLNKLNDSDIDNEGIRLNNSQRIFIRFNRNKGITDLTTFKQYLQQNPLTVQYELATPIIHKVNLTNTTKLPSYASTTHYDTIVPSNSLVPNITLPSTIDYNVAIKPSTQYTIRANTTSAMSVNLGGSTGTLSNGKVTLTTPSTLAHNSLKLGNGKAKEVMVIEGSEIKDNVPFFNGMKNVQMGGIKLVNIARGATTTALVTANANKTQFTYTGNGTGWGYILFDSSLLKPNTVYTLYMNVITNNGTDSSGSIKYEIGNTSGTYSHNIPSGYVGVHKKVITTTTDNFYQDVFKIAFRPTASGNQVVIQNPMVIEGDWTHLDEIPYIESEMIIEQPIIRSQGKNLFNIKETSVSWYGAIVTSNADNTITYTPNSDNSAALTTKFYFKQPIKVKTGIKYTYTMKRISGGNSDFGGTINNQILVRKKDGTTTNILGMSDFKASTFDKTLTATYTFDNTIESIIGISPIMYSINNLTSPIVMQFQIEEGSTATTYEPFKQHTLSSNRVIGYEKGVVYEWSNGSKFSNTNMGTITADVEGLSVAYVSTVSSHYSFWDKDGVFISGKQYLDSSLSMSDKNGFITVPSKAKYMKCCCIDGIETEATVTGELPLRSLPNGVCDSFNLVTGEYVQRVGEIVLDGSHPCTNDKTNGTLLRFNMFSMNSTEKNMIKVKSSLKCDKLPVLADVTNNQECIHNGGSDNYKLMLWIDGSHLSTQDASGLNKYLSQNPITVQYELATPIVRKIGLTAKGNYKEVKLIPNHYQSESIGVKCIRATTSGITTSYPEAVESSPIFTNDYNVRHYPVDTHGDYQYVVLIGNGIYINIPKNEVSELTTNGCRKWLEQNPIKIGILTKNSASLYSNIQKPIFFNNVKVQFMNDNVDIQPTLTLQSRSTNSYVMDMMKANTKYTLKALANPKSFIIDGTSYSATTNGTFTSPSTLTNKLLITGQDVYELMIIEGDVTGKQLPYYKGIRSAYDNTNEIEIYSANKNLIDVRKANKLANFNCSFINNGDGSVTLTGTGDGTGEGIIVTDYYFHITAGKHYTFSFESDAPIGNANGTDTVEMFLLKDAQTVAYVNINANKKTFMAHEGDYCLRFDINKNNTTHKFWNIQLVEGDIATPYQPHKENTTSLPMPTRLETVEVVKVDMLKDMEIGAINPSGENNNNTERKRLINYISVKPNQKIIIKNGNESKALNIFMYDINKNFIGYQNNLTELIIPNNCYFIRFYCGLTKIDNITITKKQYKPIALNSLPNGVKDEIVIDPLSNKAKLVQRVGKVVLDGSESWTQSAMWSSKYGVFFTRREDAKNNACLVLDRYKIIEDSANGLGKEIGYYSANDNYYLGIMLSIPCNTLDELRTMLKDNPLVAYYELATPIITEIRLTGFPFVYKDGSVQLDTEIPHTTKVKYNVNQEHLINGQNETIIRHDKQIDNLYDYIELYLEEEYRMELFRMQLELSL